MSESINNQENRYPEIVLVANEKGGTAKTATVLTLANCLKALGYECLIVDMDPSGNLSAAALTDFPKHLLYDVFNGNCSIEDAIVQTPFGDVLPTLKDFGPVNTDDPFGTDSRKSLGDFFAAKVGTRGAEKYLYLLLRHKRYAPIISKYDFVLIDSQPSDSLIITNCILAADNVIVPCEPTAAALDGLNMFQKSLAKTNENYGGKAKIDGVLLAKYDGEWKTRRDITERIIQSAKSNRLSLYRTIVRKSASIETSMNEMKPILNYLFRGNGASDSMNFSLEFLSRRGLLPRTKVDGVYLANNGCAFYQRKGGDYCSIDIGIDGNMAVNLKTFEIPSDVQEPA